MKTKIFILMFIVLSLPQAISAAGVAHKAGTLVHNSGTVYLIQNGERLGFPSLDVFVSYGYDFDMVLSATEADMKLPQGENLKFHSNSMVLDSSDGRTMYLIFDDGAHPIPSMVEMAFIKGDGRTYYIADLSAYPKASAVGLDLVYTNHPPGSLVDISGTIYLAVAGGLKPFSSAEVFTSHGYSFNTTFPYTILDERLPKLSAMQYRDGTLVNDNGTIFLISQGIKYGFKTWSGFLASGYLPSVVISGSTAGYAEGEKFE